MSIPVWVLLGFATWTLLVLTATIGVYRVGRVLTGRAGPADFPADKVEGTDFYKRAMRAHANCVENLPVYGAIVLVMVAANIESRTLDMLAVALLAARVVHTSIHLSFVQTHRVVSWRFAFFFFQVVCMAWMIVDIIVTALF